VWSRGSLGGTLNSDAWACLRNSFILFRSSPNLQVGSPGWKAKRDGLELALTYSFDAVVLDIMLPEMHGFEVARRMRDENNRTPILFLTARDTEADVVRGLDAGADDYLTKPFSLVELFARLRAIGRRGVNLMPPQLRVADLLLNPATHAVSRGEKPIALTRTEYQLLEFLMRHAERVLVRDVLIEAVWGPGATVEDNTLEVFIKTLRQKVDSSAAVKLIHTVRGFGYRIGVSAEV
jgi:two-component system response regulator MprA